MGLLFGRSFDFDHDGHVSPAEEAFGLMLFDELRKEEERRRKSDMHDTEFPDGPDKEFDDDGDDWDD